MSMSGSMMGGRSSIKAGSLRAGSTLGMAAQLNSMQLSAQQNAAINQEVPGQASSLNFAQPQPPQYPASIPEHSAQHSRDTSSSSFDKTPTETRQSFLPNPQYQHAAPMDYSPIDRAGPFASADSHMGPGEGNYQLQSYGNAQYPDVLRPGPSDSQQYGHESQPFYSDSQPYDYAPDDSGRWSFEGDGGRGGLRVANMGSEAGSASRNGSWDGGSYYGGGGEVGGEGGGDGDRGYGGSDGGGGGQGGLRIANQDEDRRESKDSWTRDALAGINFAGK